MAPAQACKPKAQAPVAKEPDVAPTPTPARESRNILDRAALAPVRRAHLQCPGSRCKGDRRRSSICPVSALQTAALPQLAPAILRRTSKKVRGTRSKPHRARAEFSDTTAS